MRASAPFLTIEQALLGFVYARPLHGYEIYRQLSSANGLWQVWRLKQSQLYALLTKLEGEHYLTATLQPQDARPPRKLYALSEAGRNAFDQWLKTPVPHGRQMRIEFLAKLYFAQRHDSVMALQLLDQQVFVCHQWLEAHQEQAAGKPGEDFFVYAVQQFRTSQVEAFLAWLAICRRALEAPV
ncbi:MAG: PadR family transcriptional regulator [Caldilineaceae bacterium]|jgi:DNA-binding PadR family transcriptional regulator|nr:PadR family transcriptional regulator [Caldilineaceae bacterium]